MPQRTVSRQDSRERASTGESHRDERHAMDGVAGPQRGKKPERRGIYGVSAGASCRTRRLPSLCGRAEMYAPVVHRLELDERLRQLEQ